MKRKLAAKEKEITRLKKEKGGKGTDDKGTDADSGPSDNNVELHQRLAELRKLKRKGDDLLVALRSFACLDDFTGEIFMKRN